MKKPPKNVCIIINSGIACLKFHIFNDNSFAFIGKNCKLKGTMSIGNGYLLIGDFVRNMGLLNTNIRNGGLVCLKGDNLFADGVNFITDDMHTIIDLKTNKRINHYGGEIIIDKHVWIGLESLIMGGGENGLTLVGKNCVIGARSIIKGIYPNNCIIAGSPGRIIRTNISWDSVDRIL